MSTTVGGVRIVDMPDLGTFTGASSVVGEKAGSGRFSGAALSGYFLPTAGGTMTGPLLLNTVPLPADAGVVAADTDRLRAYGFVGGGAGTTLAARYATLAAAQVVYPHAVALTDTLDWAAMQGMYNAAVAAGATQVAFLLPAGTAVLNHPVTTGALSVCYRGVGVEVTNILMLAGGTGAIVHGTSGTPALGHLQIMQMTITDGNASGSGSVGVSVQFSGSCVQPAMTWDTVALRKWTQPAKITNVPRGWHCDNVTLFGPDNVVQPYGGFQIIATAGFAGCFDYRFTGCMMANYTWGWDYTIQSPLEGMQFRGCSAYNGWGMIRAKCTVGGGYHSLLWAITDCDWQGLGFAVDLTSCSTVKIRGGFWIANRNTGSLPTPDGDPRRRYFAFRDTIDVTTNDMEVAVLDSQESSLSLFYSDATCMRNRFIGTHINSFSALYAVFEWANNGFANVIAELDTQYGNWVSGARVLDASNQQVAQSLARQQFVGDCTAHGMWTLHGTTGPLTSDAGSLITVPLPTRDGTHPFFLNTPTVVVASQHSTTFQSTPTVQSVSTSSFVLHCGAPAVTLAISWTATGL